MNDRKEMIDFALKRMAGFELEGSSDGDNRSIFGLIKTLLLSVPGNTLAECRKPLAAVLSIKVRNPKDKLHGSKLILLHQTIETLFGISNDLLSDRTFVGYNRDKLLEYLEVCRRIFITKSAPVTQKTNKYHASTEPKNETAFAAAMRLAQGSNERGEARDR
jgi:hypothetical protein